jgi:hypothetical protein
MLAAAVGAVTLAAPARASSIADCQISYAIIATWDNEQWFQADVTVTNIGTTPTTGWVALIAYPTATQPAYVIDTVEGSWPMTDRVLYNFTPLSYNSTLAPGGAATFVIVANGANHQPMGMTCGVG